MKRLWIAALVAVLGAQAGVITTYGNAALFSTALGGSPTVETFTDTYHFPISTGILNSSTNLPGIGLLPGMIQPGVTYSTPIGSGNFFNIDGGGGFTGGFLDGLGNPTLTIAFDAPVRGFGFDSNSLMGSGTLTLLFAGGGSSVQVVTPGAGLSMQFFGYLSDQTDIVSATLSSTGGYGFPLDNFTFGGTGAASQIPEPGSMALLAAGLGALAVWRRRTAR